MIFSAGDHKGRHAPIRVYESGLMPRHVAGGAASIVLVVRENAFITPRLMVGADLIRASGQCGMERA